jgi:hypothetical protein
MPERPAQPRRTPGAREPLSLAGQLLFVAAILLPAFVAMSCPLA